MTEVNLFRQIASFVSTLSKDTSGIVLPYVTGLVVVLIGFSVLALDGARLASSYTQMQSAADAMALAGGAELDRRPGAIARATTAVNNLLSNQLFGMGVTTPIQAQSITFYESLPPANQPLSAGTVTTNDLRARFVAVTLLPKTLVTILPVSFLGGTNSFDTGATAVAGGREGSTCQQTPMFICNPVETAGQGYDDATLALPSLFGKTTKLQLAPNNTQYFPGNFGWVQPHFNAPLTNQCGAGNPVTQTLARNTPPECFVISNLDTQTGNIANANDAINTRFDLYSQSFGGCNTNANYSPGRNVRKAYTPSAAGQQGACTPNKRLPNPPGDYAAMTLPLDSNLIANGVPDLNPNVRSGNGRWACGDIIISPNAVGGGPLPDTYIMTFDANTGTNGITQGMSVSNNGNTYTVFQPTSPQDPQTVVTPATVLIKAVVAGTPAPTGPTTFQGYWNTAHPPSTLIPGNTGNGDRPTGCTDITDTNVLNTISRTSVYDHEWQNGYQNDKSVGPNRDGVLGEVGGPTCGTPADPNLPDRRFVDVAVINCQYLHDSAGYGLTGHQENLPVAAIGKFLLTATVDAAADPIYGELSSVCTFTQLDPSIPTCQSLGGGAPPFTSQVQLYR